MNLPNDPMTLLSVIHTKLRDFYPSLKALCEDMEADENEIKEKLSAIDYVYSEELNKFI